MFLFNDFCPSFLKLFLKNELLFGVIINRLAIERKKELYLSTLTYGLIIGVIFSTVTCGERESWIFFSIVVGNKNENKGENDSSIRIAIIHQNVRYILELEFVILK